MGETTSPFSVAFEQLEQHLEKYKPLRPGFDPEEVEVCRSLMTSRLNQACGECFPLDKEEVDEMGVYDAQMMILKELRALEGQGEGPKTKIQLNVPMGTAQLLEIWANREGRAISSCVMEATLRGLSAMKADGHIPAAVLGENEYQIRLAQIREDIQLSLASSTVDPFDF